MPTSSLRRKTLGLTDGLLPPIGTMLIDLRFRLCDQKVRLADADAIGRHRESGDARGAEAIDGHATDPLRQPRQEHGRARDVRALLALGHGAADDGVLEQLRVERGSLGDEGTQRVHEEVVGAHPLQSTARRLADGRVRVAATMYASWTCLAMLFPRGCPRLIPYRFAVLHHADDALLRF